MTDFPDRLTVVEHVYHESIADGRKPFEWTHRFSRPLATRDQVYERGPQSVGEEWEPLDCGWLADNAGMLMIENREGQNLQYIPSAEEQAEIDSRVLELGCRTRSDYPLEPLWLIPPKETNRGMPATTEGLMIRCQNGRARFVVCVIPA